MGTHTMFLDDDLTSEYINSFKIIMILIFN